MGFRVRWDGVENTNKVFASFQDSTDLQRVALLGVQLIAVTANLWHGGGAFCRAANQR